MLNLANWDRVVRILIGAVLLALVLFGPRTLWGLVGIVPLVTGFIGFCPLYRLFGLNSCPRSPAGHAKTGT